MLLGHKAKQASNQPTWPVFKKTSTGTVFEDKHVETGDRAEHVGASLDCYDAVLSRKQTAEASPVWLAGGRGLMQALQVWRGLLLPWQQANDLELL